jgi:hypothetical protein
VTLSVEKVWGSCSKQGKKRRWFYNHEQDKYIFKKLNLNHKQTSNMSMSTNNQPRCVKCGSVCKPFAPATGVFIKCSKAMSMSMKQRQNVALFKSHSLYMLTQQEKWYACALSTYDEEGEDEEGEDEDKPTTPSKKAANKPKQSTLSASSSSSKKGSRKANIATDPCFICQTVGHWQLDCPLIKRKQQKVVTSDDEDAFWAKHRVSPLKRKGDDVIDLSQDSD